MSSFQRFYQLTELPLLFAMALGFSACGTADAGGSSAPAPSVEPPPAEPPPTMPPPTMPPTTMPPPTMPPPTTPPTDRPWRTLVTGDWSLAPGTESYSCVRQTIDEDLYVNAFDAVNPTGTHHTLLTMGDPAGPDGLTACSAGTNLRVSVFGSGVGTTPLQFPPGVALKIKKGTQLLLNLHLFNTGQAMLTGTSGTRVQTISASEVVNEAEGLLAGTVNLDLPPAKTTVSTGHCTMNKDSTIFAVSPHMHQLGVYERVVAERATGETVLFDGPYDFDQQLYHLIDPIQMAKGEKVRVECTHNNTTAQRVTFGESTLAEMCFSGIYRYPADGSAFTCIN